MSHNPPERETKTLTFVNVALFDKLERMLRVSDQVTDAGPEEVLYSQTVQFDDGCQMDIKVVNGESGPWCEGVLFDQGSDIGCTEVGGRLAGKYIIRVATGCDEENQKEYCVVVERGMGCPVAPLRELPTPILWERIKELRDKLARLVRTGKRGKLRDWREYNIVARILMRRRKRT